MGTPKSELLLGGETFFNRVYESAVKAFDRVVIITREGMPAPRGTAVLYDRPHAESSSIHGLLRALEESPHDKLWLLAVDFPLITEEVLRFLSSAFAASDGDYLVPVWHGKPQMLCAGYSRALLDVVSGKIEAGEHRMQSVIEGRRGELLSEHSLRERFDDEPLWNVNQPEDYAEVRRRYERT